MVVSDSRARWGAAQVRVSVWDKQASRLVDYGWVQAADLHGWTLRDFDWDAYEGVGAGAHEARE